MDTVYHLQLSSYGFLHPGRERHRTQVLKGAWPYIPGSTLYGALAAALIRLDDVDTTDPFGAAGGFHDMLRLVADQQLRVTPLLPTVTPLTTGQAYSRHAAKLLKSDPDEATISTRIGLMQAVPHAPLDRHGEYIYGSQLFGFLMHRPIVTYEGFLFAPAAFEEQLRRALRMLPILPFGGRGKFALISGAVATQTLRTRFASALQQALLESSGWVQLLSPMLLQHGASNWLMDEAISTRVTRLRRYRIWQSGLVYDWHAPEKSALRSGDYVDDNPLPGGAESRAVTGLPEGSSFHFAPDAAWGATVTDAFIDGVGHPGWAHLGWGQVIPLWTN